jgi:hypothetical protein
LPYMEVGAYARSHALSLELTVIKGQ